jgi:hypothetical protein
MSKDPLFLKFINRKVSVYQMLQSFSKSRDDITAKAATKLMDDPPDLEDFREELTDAVKDVIKEGLGEEFVAFVNNYMQPSLEEDVQTSSGYKGENVSRYARVKDEGAPWVQGFLCYNVCLYVKAFGLGSLKSCKICNTVFAHKGKYAVYCSDDCKAEGKRKKV